MNRLLKEPLLHFLLLGAALFVLFNFVNRDDAPSGTRSREIVVTPGRIENLAAQFAKTWSRPPTHRELEGLIADHVREEILYREALALGLDRDDTIVRRRMRQKIEFLSEDLLEPPDPSDPELSAYMQANTDAYRLDPRLTFKQVHLNPDKRGDSIAADAAALIDRLRAAGADADISELGDSLLLESSFDAVSQGDVKRQFGDEFSAALAMAPTGSWEGPISSAYGLHLVFVNERIDGRLPELAEIRDAVLRDLQNERRNEANEAFYEELRQRYTVTIENSKESASE